MEEEPRHVRRNVLVMSIGNTITTSANSLWIMFMPYFFVDVGITVFFIGIIFTGLAVSRAVASLIGGRAADRLGRKPVISIGFAIYTSGALVILVSLMYVSTWPTFTGFLSAIGYIVMMAGSGFRGPASSMLLIESSPEKRRGLYFMFTTRFLPSIPPAVLILVGTALYLNNLFWLALIVGIFGLLFVLALFIGFLQETHTESVSIERDLIKPPRLRSDWFLILLVAAFALDGISSSGLSWYVPIFVGRSNLDFYGVMISVSTLVIAVSALASGGLVDRIGTRAAIFGGWTLLAVTVVLFSFSTQPLEILVYYSMWVGLDMVDVSVPPLAVAERYPKEKRASVMGAYSMSVSLLSMVGPALISIAILLGDNVPFYLKAIMNSIGVVLFLIAARPRQVKDDAILDEENLSPAQI
ncbi:MFS transporter [Candidatus Thorarchaeota archaeon]|nr:MAG: MFS transporter [Candidatus Thorarchaeota archaeon]